MADHAVTSLSELVALLAAARANPATYSGKTVDVHEADYSAATTDLGGSGVVTWIDARNIACSDWLVFQAAEGETPEWPGVCADGSSRLAFHDIKLATTRVITQTSQDPRGGVARSSNASDIRYRRCHVEADPIAESDFTGYVSVSDVVGTFEHGETLDVYGSLALLNANTPK